MDPLSELDEILRQFTVISHR